MFHHPFQVCLLRNFRINFRNHVFLFFCFNSLLTHNSPSADSSLAGARDSSGRAVFRQRQWLDVLIAEKKNGNETYGDNGQQ